MVFDLRGALLKKEEIESARLMDFEFRLRVRTLRLAAATIGADPDAMARLVTLGDDAAVLRALDGQIEPATFHACREEARRQLIVERGDPTPHRLA
ncbi:hypothetical protein [Sphingomonas sp.]|uniref:hypothetical protein n=1 Tax=Sphingomonas sp. TaxID=28214 RepID=UPI00181729F4|nr:hypothetical protein [Sphingomonas sp.]MBA4762834.1 hypothetical protein [Sphingomonas sp.]